MDDRRGQRVEQDVARESGVGFRDRDLGRRDPGFADEVLLFFRLFAFQDEVGLRRADVGDLERVGQRAAFVQLDGDGDFLTFEERRIRQEACPGAAL